MFSFQTTPEVIKRGPNFSGIQVGQSLTSKHHNVQVRVVSLMPEGFPYLPFDPISLDGKLQILLRKNQTDPGVTEIIRRRQDQKIPVRNFQLYVIEDFAVISRPQEAV